MDKLESEEGAREFAFVGAGAHHGGEDGDLHAEGADGVFLGRVAAVDDECAGEIGVELGDGGGGGAAAELDEHFVRRTF